MSENKKVLSIDDLPDEVLLEIFAFFYESSIINAMAVCQRWDELITAKTTLHAKFKLQFRSCYQTEASQHYEKFKYQKLEAFRSDSETDNKLQIKILNRNKENIKQARIFSSTWSIFEKDLIGMTNLVKLLLLGIEFNENPTKMSILSLKELDIDRSPDFLDVPNLVDFNYTGPHLPTEFLETCKKLTHLTYEMYCKGDEEVPTALSAISHRLIFLKVTVEETTSLIALLESQKTSLKELEMDFNIQHDDIEFAINKLKLEKLNIYVPSDLKTLSKNSTIKELKLRHYKSGLQAIEKVLASCLSTEKLISSLGLAHNHAALKMASQYLSKLKHLVIDGKYDDEQTGNPPLNFIRTFDSMESLHIKLYSDSNMDPYLRLLANCPNLKKLKVDCDSSVSDSDIIKPIISDELQTILDNVPDLHELIVDKVLMLSEAVIRSLKRSKIRILKFTVYADKYKEQRKFAIQLSKQSDIRCTVFSDRFKRILIAGDFATSCAFRYAHFSDDDDE